MAKTTSYLSLILPAFNEYFNTWWKPTNENFTKIDDFANAFGTEVTAARGSTTNLSERLGVVLNDDGTIKQIPEIEAAKSSSVYGYGTGSTLQSLDERIELGDLESQTARQGYSALIDLLAWVNSGNNVDCLVSGPLNPITFSGAIVTLNGGVTPVISSIAGYRAVTEINDTVTISGAAATYYLKLDRNPAGKVFYTPPPSISTVGIFSGTGALFTKFSATGENFVASGVKPGHILEILAPGGNPNIGKWVVAKTQIEEAGLTSSELLIVGSFPSSGAGLDAQFLYPQAPTLGFTATPHAKSWGGSTGTAYIGRAVFDGANVTSLVPYGYQAKFADWSQVVPAGGDFSNTISHNVGYVPKSVSIYASQANDFSLPLELLSVAKMSSGAASLSVGDQSITYTAPALRRSVVVQMDDTTISIKNATNGIFYEDYSGTPQTAGYLYVVIER